ncbi:MAG: hypothetical protein WEC84_03540 [Candidatus Andersenbacteria bacterium]
MSLVMIGVLVVMVGSAAALVSRQMHQTIIQEQEEKAFHVAEGGVYYVLFLLSSNAQTVQSLLSLSDPLEKTINDPVTGQPVGVAAFTFSQPQGYAAGTAIQVTSVGQDAAGRACQQVDAVITASPIAVRLWDHPRQCAPQSLEVLPTPEPDPTPVPDPTPAPDPTPIPDPTPPPGSTIIVQDDWSGSGTLDGTSPDIAVAGGAWFVPIGAFTRNNGVLGVSDTSVSLGMMQSTGSADGFFSMSVQHGGSDDGGGHMGFAVRVNTGNGSYVTAYIAEDAGAAIAVADENGGFTYIDSAGTIAQGNTYDLELEVSGNNYTFHVTGPGIDETISAEIDLNSQSSTHGLRSWGGEDTQTTPMNFCTYTFADYYVPSLGCSEVAGGVIVQDDWSGVGSIDGVAPDIGPVGETWNEIEGIFTQNTPALQILEGEVSTVVIETNETDIMIETSVVHGGAFDSSGHSRIITRFDNGDGSYLMGYIAVDCGVCIATWNGVDFDILEHDVTREGAGDDNTIEQGVEYALTLTTSGNTIEFDVVGGTVDRTISVGSTLNNTQTKHGLGAWGGGSTDQIIQFATVTML